MSDNLRTRIAKATWISHRDRQLAQLGMKPSEYADDLPIPDWAYAIADAVIAELDLGIPCASTGCRMRQIARRGATGSGASSPPGTD